MLSSSSITAISYFKLLVKGDKYQDEVYNVKVLFTIINTTVNNLVFNGLHTLRECTSHIQC